MRERVLRVAVVLAAALAASGCIDDMVQDAFYPSMSDAVADGAIRRGWIPDWVPAGATRCAKCTRSTRA
ncbi:hypothetical protein JI752_000650 [Lysobacter sp. MMG2]|uniref:hypothetical protein n=1 Tax=Lysobacter sp. MMG2 TaxID=2801338 RepID=UPI001C214457|nr:hypothetical protein [Lysobacter sp. MMG2]MBU8974638.1 hypothetical protein [Lysobacter sp. MMG2]